VDNSRPAKYKQPVSNKRGSQVVQTITFQDFVDAFRARGRENQFSYDALRLIWDHLEEVDPDGELDVIAICCDFVEMSTTECMEQYPDIPSVAEFDGDYDQDEQDVFVQDYLEDRTTYLGMGNDGHVFLQF
jgi:hypothetical protein